MTILLAALAFNGLGIMGLLAIVRRVDRSGTTDLKRQHQCHPVDSYEHTPGEWITRRAVGDEWRCRCGKGWRVETTHHGLWRHWDDAPDLDQAETG